MSRRFRLFLFLYFLFLPLLVSCKPLSVNVLAEAALVMNADTGAILYEKNGYQEYYPASITKIVTAAYVLKNYRNLLDNPVVAKADDIATVSDERLKASNYSLPAYQLIADGSTFGIKKGEVLSLRDLMYGMMLRSGNDAANVIASYVEGNIAHFMQKVNVYVKKIGCEKSCFLNPHGIHHPNHRTTAYEMALITKAALEDPQFREIVKTVRYVRPKTNLQESRIFSQTNRLLKEGEFYYPKAMGVKTGFHSHAKNTLVAAAEDGNRTIIAVLMKNESKESIFRDAIEIFKAAFNEKKVEKKILPSGIQSFAISFEGAETPITPYLKHDLKISYYPSEEPKTRYLFYPEKKISFPIQKGSLIGKVVIMDEEDHVLQEEKVFSSYDIKETWVHWLQTFFKY